ncbi:unnamed protein product, partial [Ceratitis capitata]
AAFQYYVVYWKDGAIQRFDDLKNVVLRSQTRRLGGAIGELRMQGSSFFRFGNFYVKDDQR